MSKKGAITTIIIILFLLFILCSCCAMFFVATSAVSDYGLSSDITEEVVVDGSDGDAIALIDIQGMIASNTDALDSGNKDMVDIIIEKLERARTTEKVKAVIIRLDTPGGTVYDSHIIAQKVKQVKQEKPVIALMTTSATSGGYYISAPCDKIVASEASLTGSIGVITQITDLDGLYEKLGIDVYSVTNTQGDVKSMENLSDPNSEDRAVLEQVLDDYYEGFVNEVVNGRDMTREEVLAIADGSIFSGTRAKELGLVDELGGVDKAIEIAEIEAGISDAKVIEYNTYIDPFSNFSLLMANKINPLKVYTDKISADPGMYSYYLPK
ncbi:signal peptide peptidase SppA [Candidatus Dojkabacteria bacterium]|nr:signal peptide peptidase SppA [Candidatus Dojkabacteria bacterium]